MADLGWFSFRQRARTPVVPRSPPPEQSANQEADDFRRPKPNRVSSYINLSSRFSFSPEPPTPSTSANILVNDADRIWYNPSIKQMVEALQVIMMTKGVLQPVPTEYNSYILHLIESFQDVQDRIDAAYTSRDEAQEARDRISQDFKTVADEWAKREAQYKSEVKRLEVIIARTSRDGLETVTLARTDSIVDRGEPDARQFVSKLQQLHNQNVRHKSPSSLGDMEDYNAFLGRLLITDKNILKDLSRVDNTNHANKTKPGTSASRVIPTILGEDKDFKTSEELRGRNAMIRTKFRHKPGLQNKHLFSGIQQDNTGGPPRLETNLAQEEDDSTQPKSNGQLDFDSTSSSSNPDSEHQAPMPTDVLDSLRPILDSDPIDVADTSASVVYSQAGNTTGRNGGDIGMLSVHDMGRQASDITSGNRFSFMPGDDITFPVHGCQEVRRNPIIRATKMEPRNEVKLRLSDKTSLSQQLDRIGQWDDGSRIFLGVTPTVPDLEAPSPDRVSHGTKTHTTRPGLRSADSAGSIDTVVNVGPEDRRELRTHAFTSSKIALIRDDRRQNHRSRHKSTEAPCDVQHSRLLNQPAQRQNSAQLAASHALQRNIWRESESSR
ncbi:hypothetical protein TruAng_010921 [Truncatella angustata]|nr:hypothetical protein TruAng_010921 [Truncatella angustata]